ncbi:hypothetical protein BSLA_02r2032 [Burkholderia stabilis]|nr:hypothetical protein BSLA_02r2032 [Burkholderia stabilis]
MTEHRATPGKVFDGGERPRRRVGSARSSQESTRIGTVPYEDVGTERFREGCAVVSIPLRRNAARKRTERGGSRATLGARFAARGAAAAQAARGGRKGAVSRFRREAARAGFLTIG